MSTPIVRTATESRKSVAAWRRQGMKVAVVSTMGALHEGPSQLGARRTSGADRVILTLFANQKQLNDRRGRCRLPTHGA
ncbi:MULTISPECIES: pantoate--beta-alanine ligase [unclassified Mesorhizobium]|uniref:pantoate--beta-alanine ligase n=1 Tax=unclassified Mesorhizobium TaxID=325217 RepID=UPI0019282746|nr:MULTISPECIES: pantoate--beta-alanine ligase [unclassified Mesorhizobium]BCG97551.1 hypothetical protein MesoLj131a_64150 [Mesorhizobium sp. 131-2-1]BCH04618.1 hypothetical protein MesoLj131b_66170 [Mesorhizobium sp. 131-2-5]